MSRINETMLLRIFYNELKHLKISPEERNKVMSNIKRHVNALHPRIGSEINDIIDALILEGKTITLDPANWLKKD
jgi:hypothetical protein